MGTIEKRILPRRPRYKDSDLDDRTLRHEIWQLCHECWNTVRSEECLTHERLEELKTQLRTECLQEPSTQDCVEELSGEEKHKYTETLLGQERRPSMEKILKDLIRTKYRYGVGL